MKRLSKLFSLLVMCLMFMTTLLPATVSTTAEAATETAAAEDPITAFGGESHFHPSQLLINLQAGVDPYELADQYGIIPERHLFNNWHVFQVEGDVQAMQEELQQNELVVNAELNYKHFIPEYKINLLEKLDFCIIYDCPDPNKIDLRIWETIEKIKGNPSPVVAMVGTGVDMQHPMFEGRIAEGYDFVEQDFEPQDVHGLGTMEAGVALGSMIEGSNLFGVDPNAMLMPIRVMNEERFAYASDVVQGILYARDKGARIINVSTFHDKYSQMLQELIKECGNEPIILWPRPICIEDCPWVFTPEEPFPPNCPKCISPIYEGLLYTIGYDPATYQVSEFSDYGLFHNIAVPVQQVYTSFPGGQMAQVDGASLGSAFLTGAMSAVWSMNPEISGAEVIERIVGTAEQVEGTGEYWNNGRLDVLGGVSSF